MSNLRAANLGADERSATVVYVYRPESLEELDELELSDGMLTVAFERPLERARGTVSTRGCSPQNDVGDCPCVYEGFEATVSIRVSLPYP